MTENNKSLPAAKQNGYRTPDCDIFEDDNNFYVLMDFPGVAKDSLDITYENESISIVGELVDQELESFKIGHREYRSRSFRRVFSVPEHIDVEGIAAKLSNGELTLTLPKSEEVKPKKIAISLN